MICYNGEEPGEELSQILGKGGFGSVVVEEDLIEKNFAKIIPIHEVLKD